MEYKRFNNKIVARIDKGEEILTQLLSIAEKEKIKLAAVSAIGATDNFTVGVFKTFEKQYVSHDFTGDYEILSLAGIVTSMNGKPYVHAHMTAAGEGAAVVGGHLNRAIVSVTCEAVINIIEGTVDRQYNDELGINLLKF